MAGNVVEFYIKNFMRNGTLVTEETKFQTIPIVGDPVIDNPTVKVEMGKAGSFEFEVEPVNYFYDACRQIKTIMRVKYFGHTIFRGRVLTIGKVFRQRRSIHCEGDFAFFMDSHQPGTEEDARPEISVLEYLQQLITKHNFDMHGDTDKLFTLGEVPGQYTSATPEEQRVNIPTDKASQKFGDTSWNTTMDRLENLLSDFGGYFRTRYDEVNNVTYLDWYDKFYNATINPQTIEIAKNLIDINGSTEVQNLFTVIVPIGKDKNGKDLFINDYWPIASASHEKVEYITVPELASIPLYSDAELNANYHKKADYLDAINRFGYIWKPVPFENADTPEKLFSYAKDWMKNNYVPELTQWSVGALDMKIIHPTAPCILCGDRVNLRHPEVQNEISGFTIISAEYPLYDPKSNKYVIGIPHQEINASYGTKTKGKGGGGSGGGISSKPPPENGENTAEIEVLKQKLVQQYAFKTEVGGDITLDNPLAYKMYNTDVTEVDKATAIKELMATASELMHTRQTRWSELLPEAVRRGVPIDDPQLLIDFTPSEKQKQTQFKNQTANHMVNTIGLNHQQANVLLNETASQSYFASLVDDEGNWTPYALSQGASVWQNSADLKHQAFMTKKLLEGKELPSSSGIPLASQAFNGFQNLLTGDALNIGNIVDTDKVVDEVSGAVTKVVNFLDQDIKFNFTNPTPGTANPGKSTASFGKTSNGWKITMNEPFTYTDAQGQQQTADGSVAAQDFNLPEIASMKTKLLVVDNLVASKAAIADLEAVEARVQTLETDTLTATKVATMTLYVFGINSTLLMSSTVDTTILTVQKRSAVWTTLDYVASLSLSLTGSHKFEDVDTGQAITGKLVTSYSKLSNSIYVLAAVGSGT